MSNLVCVMSLFRRHLASACVITLRTINRVCLHLLSQFHLLFAAVDRKRLTEIQLRSSAFGSSSGACPCVLVLRHASILAARKANRLISFWIFHSSDLIIEIVLIGAKLNRKQQLNQRHQSHALLTTDLNCRQTMVKQGPI